jgi:hypothetical protein
MANAALAGGARIRVFSLRLCCSGVNDSDEYTMVAPGGILGGLPSLP